MENVVFTQLSVTEVRMMIREEVTASLNNSQIARKEKSSLEYLTIEEVAKYINMAVSSVYGFVHNKRIPYIKRGKRLIFEKSKIDEWLQGGRQRTIQEIEDNACNNFFTSKKNK